MRWVHARAGTLMLAIALLGAGAVTSGANAAGEPQISGGAIDARTKTPVLGEPYIAARRNTIPTPRLVLPAPVQTIAGVLRYGVRARVLCPRVACYALVGLSLGKTALVFSDTTIAPGGRAT